MISQSQRLSGGNWHGVTREQAREFEAVETTLRMNAQGTLEDLARGTGGFLVGDSNEVAYTPSDRRADGRFHRLGVRVKRSGATVQSRDGYLAVPHAAGEPVLGYEGLLVAALAARRPPRELEHGAAVFRFATEGERVQHALVVAAPLERVRFNRDERAGRYLGRVSLLALARAADGEIVEKLGQDSLIEGPLADLDQTRGRRLSFVRRLVLRPGTHSVETAVRDGLGDRVG